MFDSGGILDGPRSAMVGTAEGYERCALEFELRAIERPPLLGGDA
jgi:hypothetical protein